ncbi:MAG: Npt1/Npt2 family nucleotide transporter [Candidatus Electryonea clarkiae]|nr:Npt1/Npt2 family nucleotide transporter [Candidatus Electryonea clarkiae]
MVFYAFLLVATIVLIKPVRISLFLSRFDISYLPYAFILVAISSGLVVALYTKLSTKYRINRLITFILIDSVIFLLLFWIILRLNYQPSWFYFLFYVWVSIFAVIVTTQFWILANFVYNAREAKRLFGLLGAGSIIGGIFGGYLADLLAHTIGTANILLVGVVFLFGCIILLQKIWQTGARDNYVTQMRRQKKDKFSGTTDNIFKIAFKSKHIAYTAGLTGIMVVVSNLVDYQYSAIASENISDPDELTAFFGLWLSNLSVLSLLIQILLTSRVIQRFGIVSSLFFLPAGISFGVVATLMFGGLPSAIILKLADGGFKNSIHKAGMELLSIPIPAAIKDRVKAFTGVLVDNVATGIGGFLVIALTQWAGWGTEAIGVLILVFIILWLFMNFGIGKEYIRTFRAAIEKRTIQLDEQTLNIQDPALFKGMLDILDGNNERQILYVLELIGDVKNDQFIPYIDKLLSNSTEQITLRAVRMALRYEQIDFSHLIKPLVNHINQEIRIEAMRYVCLRSDDPTNALISFLNEKENRVRLSALMGAALERQSDPVFRKDFDFRLHFQSIIDDIQETIDDPDELELLKVEIARILGISDDPELFPYLHLLLGQRSLPVLRQAILSAGKTRSEEFIPSLIAHLNTRFVTKDIRQAIASYGNTIIEPLAVCLSDPKEDRRVRISITNVLADIGTQEAVDVIMDNLIQSDQHLYHAVIKGLSKLRSWYTGLRFDPKLIDQSLQKEIEEYYLTVTILITQKKLLEKIHKPGRKNKQWVASQLLIKAIEEHLDRNLDRIFRYLGLLYNQGDIYNAYLGIISGNKDLRDNAVEFLDNVLNRKLKKSVLPIAEATSRESLLPTMKELYGHTPTDETGSFNLLLQMDSDWLKACTLYLISQSGEKEFLVLAKNHLEDNNKIVAETAELAFNTLS